MSLRRDHFDFIARHYDRLIGGIGVGPLADSLRIKPGDWLLDVGGGTGRVSQLVGCEGARVVVCDRSRQMLSVARTKGLTGVQASVDHLPFSSASIERVLVVDAFHHFTGSPTHAMQARAAGELVRVLRPAGRLIVQEPDIRRAVVRLLALGERLLLMRSRFLAPEDLTEMVGAAGANLVATREDRHKVTLTWTKPAPPIAPTSQ